jgi:hypothetical protein
VCIIRAFQGGAERKRKQKEEQEKKGGKVEGGRNES